MLVTIDPAPVVDAGERGGALALISNERSSRQERPSRYYDGNSEFDVASRYEERRPKRGGPMPDSMREELFSLPKTKMSPSEKMAAMNTIKQTASRERSRKRIRDRAGIGAAAVGSLAGILGLSNINKESEEEANV